MSELQQNRRLAKSASVRTRFTPTFFHHDIFGTSQMASSHVRVTPTFESTVFNCDGYLVQTHHSRTLKTKEQRRTDPEMHVYINESTKKKQAFLNPCQEYYTDYRSSRCTDDKERLADDINHMGGRTSRLRKCVEQMSNPIFGGYTWTPYFPRDQQQPEEAYNPNQYRYGKAHNSNEVYPEREAKQQVGPQPHIQIRQQRQKKSPVVLKQPAITVSKPANKSSTKHTNNLKRFKSAANLRNAPK